MPTTWIRGTTIHVEQDGTGPDLLFVHGMCGDARVWDGQVGRLRDRFRCTTYDRRGHSRSGGGGRIGRDDTHAADAVALVEALGLQPVIVASSGGARIALEVLRSAPGAVLGAVLSEPPLFSLAPDAGAALRDVLAPRIEEAMRAGGPAAAVDAFFGCVCPGLWSRIGDDAKRHYRANAPAMLAELAGRPSHIGSDDVARLRTPALVLSGGDSHPTLRAIAATLARTLPDARWLELDRCGHVTYAEQPEQFAAAVADFAAEVITGGRTFVAADTGRPG